MKRLTDLNPVGLECRGALSSKREKVKLTIAKHKAVNGYPKI